MAKKAPKTKTKQQFFKNDAQRAAAYAAMKLLEQLVGKDGLDGAIPPGFAIELDGVKVTVQIPPGTHFEQELGTNGDGTNSKKATQDMYGWTVWALFFQRLQKFNQANVVKAMLLEAMKEAVSNPNLTVADKLEEIAPDLAEAVAKLKEEFPPPMRIENAKRRVDRKDKALLPGITVEGLKAA